MVGTIGGSIKMVKNVEPMGVGTPPVTNSGSAPGYIVQHGVKCILQAAQKKPAIASFRTLEF